MTRRSNLTDLRADYPHALADARKLIAASTRSTSELAAVIADTRASLAVSLALLQRTVTAPEKPAGARTFAAIDELIARIERTTSHGDPVDDVIAAIKAINHADTDPHLVMGILLEGMVQVLLQRTQADTRRDTVIALCTMLCQRLNLLDVGPP